MLIQETIDSIIPKQSKEASVLPIDVDAKLAVDWFNGRRTPDANQLLSATLS